MKEKTTDISFEADVSTEEQIEKQIAENNGDSSKVLDELLEKGIEAWEKHSDK